MSGEDRRGGLERWITGVWYSASAWRYPLLPLSWLYRLLVALRRAAYRIGFIRSHRGAQPVVVVGNLTVGGTGKTPLVLWLVEALRERGMRPAVISRGYGAEVGPWPVRVTARTPATSCGDEPALIARRAGVPVVVHPDRVAALRSLSPEDADVVISDDGLQHLRLARDYEIVVLDGRRGLGNSEMLPAGPLREPYARLQQVDAVVVNGGEVDGLGMRLEATALVCPATGARELLSGWIGRRVAALAGIGDPERFFTMLGALGLEVVERRALPDHAPLGPDELGFPDHEFVVMTEKDAVRGWERLSSQHWYLEVTARLYDEVQVQSLLEDLMRSLRTGPHRPEGGDHG